MTPPWPSNFPGMLDFTPKRTSRMNLIAQLLATTIPEAEPAEGFLVLDSLASVRLPSDFLTFNAVRS
jgi:hypothetical protein